MRIESLLTKPDRAGRYKAILSDGTVLRLYRQTVEDFGLYTGMELEPEALKRLREAAGQMSAKMRAVRILSASSVSEKDLEQRLVRKGERTEDAREAVQWMQDMQLLDDRETARQTVSRSRISKTCIRSNASADGSDRASVSRRAIRRSASASRPAL